MAWMRRRPTKISIHAPRGGSDRPDSAPVDNPEDFNPRSPWGERHGWLIGLAVVRYISIHAPRGGSDLCPIG